MSNFINQDDYLPYISEKRLTQAVGGDFTILDTVENTAIQVVRDALYPKYDTQQIFATVGNARPKQVLRWCIILSVYYIYERIPDALAPDRVQTTYEETITMLSDIADGKKSVELPRALDENENVKTKIRWGSQSKRTHNTN